MDDPGAGPTGQPDDATDRIDPTDPIDRFLASCAAELTALVDAGRAGPEVAAGAAALTEALARATPLPFEPTWLPTLDTLDLIDDDTPQGRALRDLAPALRWIPTMRADDGGTDFALAPFEQMRDLAPLTVGLMYVRPGAQYPLHHHPPQELYLTLAGRARWRYGGHDDFRPLGPGTTLYNHPGDLHSAIAGDTPLVALYVLWP